MKYKIVDTFNGGSDDRRFGTEAEAEAALDRDRAEFYKANTPNTICCLDVVDASETYGWNQFENAFVWE